MTNGSRCADCAYNNTGFCGSILNNAEKSGAGDPESWRHYFIVPAKGQILTQNQATPDVHVLCSGWAYRYLRLQSGRRQILNFILPGDLFSACSVFKDWCSFSVKALTDVQICAMKRAEVLSRATADFTIVQALADIHYAEMRNADRTIATLGQQSAEERIAHLFLHLMKRIAARNIIRDDQYPLPLRHEHIADAAGLTAVHVSRTIGAFRDRDIVDLSKGILKVINLRELQRLGTLN